MKISLITHKFIGDMLMCEAPIQWLLNCPSLQIEIIVKSASAEWIANKCFDCPVTLVPNNKALVQNLRQHKPDATLHLDRGLGTVLSAFAARIPYRFGVQNEGRQWLLTQSIAIQAKTHHSDTHFALIELFFRFGLAQGWLQDTPEKSKQGSRLQQHRQQLHQPHAKPQILVHLGTTRRAKSPPIEIYKTAIEYYIQKQWAVVLVGDDQDLCQALIQSLAEDVSVLNIDNQVGQTTLDAWFDLIAQADLVLSPDTATMHIANSMGVPTIALFGSTDATLTGGQGEQTVNLQGSFDCAPCFRDDCQYQSNDPNHLGCFKALQQPLTQHLERQL